MTSIFTERAAPKVVIFACKWCGGIGADRAGKARISLPTHFRLIRVECGARIEPDLILRALADGIDGVAVLGCHLGGCRYNHANHSAAKRVELLQTLLDAVGVGSTRLLVSWGTAHEPHQFAELVSRFFQELQKQPSLDCWVRPTFVVSYEHAGTGERKS